MPTQAFLRCKAEPIITMLKVCPNIPEKLGALFLTFSVLSSKTASVLSIKVKEIRQEGKRMCWSISKRLILKGDFPASLLDAIFKA